MKLMRTGGERSAINEKVTGHRLNKIFDVELHNHCSEFTVKTSHVFHHTDEVSCTVCGLTDHKTGTEGVS